MIQLERGKAVKVAWRTQHPYWSEEDTGRFVGRNLLRGVTLNAAEDDSRLHDRPRSTRTRDRNPVVFPIERVAIDRQPRVVREFMDVVWQILKVRSIVPSRDEAQALDLGRDVVRSLEIADPADLTSRHRVVGELVQPGLQISFGDR